MVFFSGQRPLQTGTRLVICVCFFFTVHVVVCCNIPTFFVSDCSREKYSRKKAMKGDWDVGIRKGVFGEFCVFAVALDA